jgi:hypothetical protein
MPRDDYTCLTKKRQQEIGMITKLKTALLPIAALLCIMLEA